MFVVVYFSDQNPMISPSIRLEYGFLLKIYTYTYYIYSIFSLTEFDHVQLDIVLFVHDSWILFVLHYLMRTLYAILIHKLNSNKLIEFASFYTTIRSMLIRFTIDILQQQQRRNNCFALPWFTHSFATIYIHIVYIYLCFFFWIWFVIEFTRSSTSIDAISMVCCTFTQWNGRIAIANSISSSEC